MTILYQHHELIEVMEVESFLKALKIWNVAKKKRESIFKKLK